jgi:sorbitol-specific phosphotransferase system component IIBC
MKLILFRTAIRSINHLAYHLPPGMVIAVVVDVVIGSGSEKNNIQM